MTTVPDTIQLGGEVSNADCVAWDELDPRVLFDRWLQQVQPGQHPVAPPASELHGQDTSEIFIGSFPGSNCEVSFEGVLHFDGYSIGNITSPDGTLVLTKRGRIEADINVGVAVIAGSVTGDITASERVVLESDARVTGQIKTPALSVRLGAVFDGDCVLITAKKERLGHERQSVAKQSGELEHLALGAGAGRFASGLRH
jgi:cytoskeletal protein CcmA (bactofilin family)